MQCNNVCFRYSFKNSMLIFFFRFVEVLKKKNRRANCMAGEVGILTLRRAIPELLLRKVGIGTK